MRQIGSYVPPCPTITVCVHYQSPYTAWSIAETYTAVEGQNSMPLSECLTLAEALERGLPPAPEQRRIGAGSRPLHASAGADAALRAAQLLQQVSDSIAT